MFRFRWQIRHFGEYQLFLRGMRTEKRRPRPYRMDCIRNGRSVVNKLDAMQIFVRVVEKGRFSAVAKERGIGQPAVSKQVSALEHVLGTGLIDRDCRSIPLTDSVLDFYESTLRILDISENATSRIGRVQTAPKGLIRVTVPPRF